MNRMRRTSVVSQVILLFTMTGQASFSQEGADRIYRDDGTLEARGRIVEVSPTHVSVDARGLTTRVQADKIRRIAFAGAPFELQRLPDMIKDGRYEDAQRELARMNPNEIRPALARVDYDYFEAVSRARLAIATGDGVPEAAKSIFDFLKTHRNTYHFYPGQEVLGDLAVALGRFDLAAQAYGSLRKAPWPGYQLRGAILEASALMAQKKYQEALGRYTAVISSSQATADAVRQKNLATVGRAVCQAELGKPEQGLEDIERLIRDNSPSDVELFARAYNGKGACYRKMDRTKDAIFAYLFVDTLFARQADAHAEALYHLGPLWKLDNKPARADQVRKTLRERYPGSHWARQ